MQFRYKLLVFLACYSLIAFNLLRYTNVTDVTNVANVLQARPTRSRVVTVPLRTTRAARDRKIDEAAVVKEGSKAKQDLLERVTNDEKSHTANARNKRFTPSSATARDERSIYLDHEQREMAQAIAQVQNEQQHQHLLPPHQQLNKLPLTLKLPPVERVTVIKASILNEDMLVEDFQAHRNPKYSSRNPNAELTCDSKLNVDDVEVTLVTQTTKDRLWMIKEYCERWPGRISVAVGSTSMALGSIWEDMIEVDGGKCVERIDLVYVKITKDPDMYPINSLRNAGES